MIGADHPDTLVTRGNLAACYRAPVVGRGHRPRPARSGGLSARPGQRPSQYPSNQREPCRQLSAPASWGTPSTSADRRWPTTNASWARSTAAPSTCGTDLAASYDQAGHPEEAVILGRQVLASREQFQGTDHPDTLLSRGSLAAFHFQAGQLDDAIALGTQATADYERLHGSDHSMTLATRCNLGSFHHHAGHRDEAVSLLTDVVEARARLLPPDNGELVATRVSLAAVQTARGRTLLPEDTAGAWRDAGAAVQTVGLCLADAPTAYGPALADAYRLAADALAVDGQPQAAAHHRSLAATARAAGSVAQTGLAKGSGS
ncbi:tetratricopeptide repeat protein (plasmid) [Kitasatospora cathayae]|uniref:Tetratricopeptide repeat protein n=1 Tax=Kitasatospora cathayae TaxID=3004092 RepID=A0ABY7QH34_9ACTN|nr:tetratricopeptide repeat protein [Kitasatospora sp. HUAS 3-15]WBP92118.1 tetratricopeptide repeat protein [Kitasatospora sp. HUAS 3-15]